MDHAIYTAMGAASQTLNQQAVTASNLANASTPGFRAQLNALRAVPVEGLSLPTRTLVTASTPGADMTPGKMDYTSRPLDVALQQDGWLAVQTADGSEGYTRARRGQLLCRKGRKSRLLPMAQSRCSIRAIRQIRLHQWGV
ncbi:hypothetical protein BWR13_19725 [Escherichia coli]|nr:hypothetical protein BWR13_19725 [Escherichia coli]